MLKYNQLLKEFYEGTGVNRKIDSKSLQKEKSKFKLLVESKSSKAKNYLEKQFEVMISNISNKELIKIIKYNIEQIKNNLKKIVSQITNEELKEKSLKRKSKSLTNSISESNSSPSPRKHRFLPEKYENCLNNFSFSENSDEDNFSLRLSPQKINRMKRLTHKPVIGGFKDCLGFENDKTNVNPTGKLNF